MIDIFISISNKLKRNTQCSETRKINYKKKIYKGVELNILLNNQLAKCELKENRENGHSIPKFQQ